MKPQISVIIRSKDEERWIGHAIQSVIDHIPNNEIIIIDNNSVDSSKSIASSFKRDPDYNDKDSNYTDIKILDIDEYTPGKAINLGVQNSSSDLICILSSHCVIQDINLDNVIKSLDSYAGIFGNQTPIYQGKKIQKRYLWSHFQDKDVENMYSQMENRHFFHNAISFFSKETLISHPFNETLVGKEDRYWARDVVAAGLKTLYMSSIIVDHHYTPRGNTWKGIG